MTFAIIGSGALGAYYGALLQRAGFETHFLFHRDYEHVSRHGLRIKSKRGDFDLPKIHVYAKASDLPPCDVTLVGLKTTSNPLLPELVTPPTRKGGCVLTLQNGLGNEEALAAVVGPERVLGGVAFLCSNRTGPGEIHHLDYGHVSLGEFQQSEGITDRLRTIGSAFQKAGVETELSDNLLQTRWKKLMWNIPFNGLNVLLRCTTDQILASPHGLALAKTLMEESRLAAEKLGYAIPQEHAEKLIEYTYKMTPYKSSMMLDFEAGRPMEVESMFGAPLWAAQSVGCESPSLSFAYQQLAHLDKAQRT